jgi:predicted dehydrogenase
VILDASHEFDMLTYLFGPIRKITGEFGRIADITYDAEDYAEAMVLCGKTTASVYLSYFGKPAQRVISIETSTGRLEADLIGGEVTFCGQPYRRFGINRDQWFLDQLAYFFENLGNPSMMNGLEEASYLFKTLVQFKSITSLQAAPSQGSRKSAPNT